MRVLFHTYQAHAFTGGGGKIQLLKTREYLRRLGIDVDLFDPWRTDPKEYAIYHHFGAIRFDVGICETARWRGARVVISPIVWRDLRSAIFQPAPSAVARLKRIAIHLYTRLTGPFVGLEHRLLHGADLLLPNARVEAELVRRLYGVPLARQRVVPNGVDPRFADGDPRRFRERYGLSDFVLVVGAFCQRKAQLSLLRALQGLDVPMVLIGEVATGDRWYYERCRAAAGPKTLFLEEFEHDSELLRSCYAAADTFVLPSWAETPGLAALEAGLAGAKVVITSRGSTREYFGDLARYIEPWDLAGMRRQVEAALAAPRSAALREHIARHYTWDRVAAQTLDHYRELLRQ